MLICPFYGVNTFNGELNQGNIGNARGNPALICGNLFGIHNYYDSQFRTSRQLEQATAYLENKNLYRRK